MKLIGGDDDGDDLALAPLLAADNEPAARLNEAAAVFGDYGGTGQGHSSRAHREGALHRDCPGAQDRGVRHWRKFTAKGICPVEIRADLVGLAPGTVRIEGGSVGFQIGASPTDLIMLVMSERGADKLLTSKFTLGGGRASVAGRPRGTHGHGPRPTRRC